MTSEVLIRSWHKLDDTWEVTVHSNRDGGREHITELVVTEDGEVC